MSITTGQYIPTTLDAPVFTANNICSITTVWLFNHSETNNANIEIYLVKDGDTPGDTNKIAEFLIVPKDSFYTNLERFVLDQNDSLYIKTDLENTVSCVISFVNKE